MITWLSTPSNLLHLSSRLLIGGVAMLLGGIVVAYGVEGQLTIATQVFGHSLVILGPTLLKIGYVLRLTAQRTALRGACALTHVN
ncbi:hypothetical protein D3C76_218250 [compost metagenome]